jgi:uncharacterized OB-fold protein
MAGTIRDTRIQSHTEYTITRSRCRRCGASIPAETVDAELCTSCVDVLRTQTVPE